MLTFILPVFIAAMTTPEVHKSDSGTPQAPARPKQTLEKPSELMRPIVKQTPNAPAPLFPYPGVISYKDGRWQGGDNFVNLERGFPIQVTIVKPADLTSPVTEAAVQSKIEAIFSSNNITFSSTAPTTSFAVPTVTPSSTPLPFFNMMILLYPIKDGIIAGCQGRFFEDVKPTRFDLTRFKLDNDTFFQAITWEHSNLVVAPKEEMESVIMNAVANIANNFAKRVSSAPKSEDKEVE